MQFTIYNKDGIPATLEEMAPISRFHFRAVWIIAILLAALLVATVIIDRIPIAKSTIQTDVVINSSASEVWQELTDFEEYPQWNPFMLQVTGAPSPGEQLEILMRFGDGTMTITPTVLVSLPDRELRWIGHLLVPGLFDGEHSLVIEPLSEDRVRFLQSESFSGLLIPFSRRILEDTKLNFEAMNQALKKRAEEAN